MRSPFKFLDAYEVNDQDVFFGRQEETDALYKMIFETSHLLVYGLSGTGKTSLVQCGLSSRFDGPDWYPLFIRRHSNINHSLRNIIRRELPTEITFSPETSLTEQVQLVFRHFLRPVYLLFDQFEELSILGDEEEQKKFAHEIHQLIDAELPCKIVFIMREEFIGQLYYLEKEIPTIYDFRLRLEPMGLKKITEVILKSFATFNIELENEEENIKAIYENLSAEKSGIQLPYLQVYLDLLYREKFAKTYPELAHQEALSQPFLEMKFTNGEIEEFGRIKDVMGRFLQEQYDQIGKDFHDAFPTQIKDIVNLFLDVFVTEEGTKRPIKIQHNGAHFIVEENVLQLLPKISTTEINFLLEHFIQARLIRERDGFLELGHDSLASLISDERDELQVRLNELYTSINSAYINFQKTGLYLSSSNLNYLLAYLPDLENRLSKDQKTFIDASLKHVRKKRQRINSAILVAFLLLAAMAFNTYRNYISARNNNEEFLEANKILTESRMEEQRLREDAVEGLKSARKAQNDAIKAREYAEIAQISAELSAKTVKSQQIIIDSLRKLTVSGSNKIETLKHIITSWNAASKALGIEDIQTKTLIALEAYKLNRDDSSFGDTNHPAIFNALMNAVISFDKDLHFDFPAAHEGAIRDIIMHPNGQQFFTSGNDRKIKSWKIESWHQLGVPNLSSSIYFPDQEKVTYNHLSLNPDGTRLLITGKILGKDTIDSQEIIFPNIPKEIDYGLVSKADYRLLNDSIALFVLGFDSGRTMLIETNPNRDRFLPGNGDSHKNFKPHQGAITDFAFSENDKKLAIASEDGTISIWDLERYQDPSYQALRINSSSGKVLSIIFANNDEYIISSCQDGSLYFWNLDPDQYASFLCQKLEDSVVTGLNRAYDELSSEDYQRYFGEGVGRQFMQRIRVCDQ